MDIGDLFPGAGPPAERLDGPAPSDEAVQATHVDAACAKASCAKLGYFEDRFTEALIRSTRPNQRSPLIHRGYYSRVMAMRRTVMQFLKLCPAGTGCQIVNLGAGLDTLYFWLRESSGCWRDDLVYFDVDFPEILAKKLTAIQRKSDMWPCLDVTSKDQLVSAERNLSGMKELHTAHCRFVSVDMRMEAELTAGMTAAGFQGNMPTIFLSECVLVYMQSLHGDNIVQWAANLVPNAPSVFVTYEQTNPNDAFGKVMVDNLMRRGCPLLSVHDYPTLEDQRQRYLTRGWQNAFIGDMNEIYNRRLDRTDVMRIQKIEWLDEIEEWQLIQAHYFVLIATRAADESGAWVHALAADSPPMEADPPLVLPSKEKFAHQFTGSAA